MNQSPTSKPTQTPKYQHIFFKVNICTVYRSAIGNIYIVRRLFETKQKNYYLPSLYYLNRNVTFDQISLCNIIIFDDYKHKQLHIVIFFIRNQML